MVWFGLAWLEPAACLFYKREGQGREVMSGSELDDAGWPLFMNHGLRFGSLCIHARAVLR